MCILGHKLKRSRPDIENLSPKSIKLLHSLLFLYVNIVWGSVGSLEPYLVGSGKLFRNITLKLHCSRVATSHM